MAKFILISENKIINIDNIISLKKLPASGYIGYGQYDIPPRIIIIMTNKKKFIVREGDLAFNELNDIFLKN